MNKEAPRGEILANAPEIISDTEITKIPQWNTQLATLLRTAWTGQDGVSYPPYPGLADATYWEETVVPRWDEGGMHSWVAVKGGRILSHAAIVRHEDQDGEFFEIGRLAVVPDAPKGITTKLFMEGANYMSKRGLYGFLDGTTSHSHSQYMARVVAGWRFAGYEYRGDVGGKHWDVVLLDNAQKPDFEPAPGIVGELRSPIACTPTHRARFAEIDGRVTADRTMEITPGGRIHTLPDLVVPLSTIIALNK